MNKVCVVHNTVACKICKELGLKGEYWQYYDTAAAEKLTVGDTAETERRPDPNIRQVGGDHYQKMKIQHWDLVLANEIPYLEAMAIKYLMRHRDKGGIDDIRKAIHFCEKIIAEQYLPICICTMMVGSKVSSTFGCPIHDPLNSREKLAAQQRAANENAGDGDGGGGGISTSQQLAGDAELKNALDP